MAQLGYAENITQHTRPDRDRETVREQLATALRDRAAGAIVPLAGPEARAIAPADRRSVIIAQAEPLVDALGIYVRREVLAAIDNEQVEPYALDIEDVIAATYLRALDRADEAPIAGGIYPWLRRIANATVQAFIDTAAEQQELEASLDAAMPREIVLGEEDWHQTYVPLIDRLPDETALQPEEVVVDRMAGRSLAQVFARIPEREREVFMLKVVDGWDDDDIAAVEGVDPDDVPRMVERTRRLLRDWLHGMSD